MNGDENLFSFQIIFQFLIFVLDNQKFCVVGDDECTDVIDRKTAGNELLEHTLSISVSYMHTCYIRTMKQNFKSNLTSAIKIFPNKLD